MTSEDRDPESREFLRKSVTALRILAEKKKAPTRHHARDLLLALGAAIRSGEEHEIDEALATLQRIVPLFGPTWRAVVTDELSLACTEHVRSVEPRYLDHPHYDFEYTTAARERLELRLRAADRLELPAKAQWLADVARADALLAASIERRSQKARKKG